VLAIRLALASLLLSSSGCFSDVDSIASDTDSATATTDGTQPNDASSGDETSSDDEPSPACGGASEACVPAPPNGWAGPTFVYEGAPDEQPSCPSAAPDVSVDLSTGLFASDAICGCACGDPLAPICPDAILRIGDGVHCDSFPHDATLVAEECQEIPSGGSYWVQGGLPNTSFVGSCEAEPSVETAEASWEGAVRACIGSVSASGCSADQVCVTQPPLSPSYRVCVHRAGDQSCPLQGYTERVQAYAGFDDTRACESCECGEVVDGRCSRTVELFPTDDCTGRTNDTLSGGNTCSQVADSISANLATSISGECPPNDPAPIGGVTPTGVETLCCLP
jgi:hypothetical protein